MKFLIKLALVFTVILPVISYADIECAAVSFDMKVSTTSNIVNLKKEDQQYSIVFKTIYQGNRFNVVIDKANNDITGSIEKAGSETTTFTGAFNSYGVFEFTKMSGGNIAMPEKLLGVSCRNH